MFPRKANDFHNEYPVMPRCHICSCQVKNCTCPGIAHLCKTCRERSTLDEQGNCTCCSNCKGSKANGSCSCCKTCQLPATSCICCLECHQPTCVCCKNCKTPDCGDCCTRCLQRTASCDCCPRCQATKDNCNCPSKAEIPKISTMSNFSNCKANMAKLQHSKIPNHQAIGI